MNTNQSIIARRYSLLCLVVGVLFTLGIGNAWSYSYYYTGFKATGGAKGKGYVYASTSNTATPVYETEVTAESQSDDLGSSGATKQYYAWAKAVRGGKFNGWSISGDNGNVTPTSGTDSPITVTVTSAEDKTNMGTATATWTTYAKVNVTYNPSEDGIYSVTYQYDSYNETTKEITTGDAENLSRTISSENGAQTIGSYKNDVITLKSTSGTFQGWYSDAGFTSLLSKANPYTYTAPTSGSAAVYPKYEHVDKYYGRLTASIAAVPYSMPGGGTIFISKEEAGTGTYSADAQTVDNVSMGTTGLKYYLHAKPNDKRYVFRGWYSNPECKGTALSTSADYTYTFTATSMNSASPTLGNVYAAFDFNLFYMQVEVEPAVPGLGMVLVKDNNTGTPVYTDYTTHAEQFLYAYRLAPTANAYLYAKPKYGYKFSGWYDNPDCTGTAKSTANPYTYAATGTSTDPMNPTIIKLYAKFVEDASTVNITYNLPDQTKGEYTASVLDIAEVDNDFIWTFTQVFTSEGKTGNTTQAQHKTDVLRLEAQPKAGYGVTSWTIAGAAKTTPSQLYEATGTAAATYGVTFGDAKPFLVSTNSTQYATLREALTAVGNSGQITVVQNAYVAAGNYTIPKNVTLLVPFNDSYTCYKEMTGASGTYASSFSKPSVYVTLTLGSGANIILNGEMSVSATMCWAMGNNGSPSGKYGLVRMNSGSTITLKNDSKLYAWGYITGEGAITAESGSHTYEGFQVTGYRGGNATSGMAGNSQKVFPMNQYYIQNIENKITFQAGALEHLYMGVTSSWGDEGASLDFIGGPNSTNTLFLLKNGTTLTKWYDPSKDRQKYELNGDATLDQIVLDVASVSSKDYVLPITNNMDLDIVSGTTTINYDVAIFPDVNIHIRQGAQITIKKNVYVYDAAEWNPAYAYAKFTNNDKNTQGAITFKNVVRPIEYTTMTKYSRTSVVDAKIVVDGTLNIASGGKLFTTTSGANICSEHTGVVQIGEACSANSVTYQAVQSTTGRANTIHHYDAITVNPARLHNADDSYTSYTATLGAVANDQFIYSKSQERWLKNPKVITWNANGGTTETSTMAYSEGAFIGALPAAYKDGYTLEGWYTAASGGTAIGPTTKVTANATYHAHWTPKTFTITYRDQGGAAFSGTHVDSPNAHPTTHTFGTATTLNNATRSGYDFGGWYRTPSCSGTVVTSIPASTCKNITLYAKWTEIPGEKYNLTIAATPSGYGTVDRTSVTNIPSGSAVTKSSNTFTVNGVTVTATPAAATAQYTYAFKQWNNLPATVTANVTNVQAEFTRTVNKYTVTWKNEAGSAAIETDANQEYGATTAFNGTTPTKSATAQYTYTFAGWSTEANGGGTKYANGSTPTVSGNVTYYAYFTSTVNKYSFTIGVTPTGYGSVNHTSITNIPYGSEVTTSSNTFTVNGTTVTATPTAATAQYTYAFSKWNNLPATVTANVTNVQAEFTRTVNKYTVTWKNANGTTLETDENVAYGTTPTYNSATPTKAQDDYYTYTHNGWTPAVGAITGNTVYTATYSQTPRTYSVTLNTNGGTINAGDVTEYTYGTGATLPTNVTKDGHEFGGWFDNSGLTGDAVTTISTSATGNKEYWAKWTASTYTVTLNTNSGTVNAGNITSYTYGTGATLPSNVTKTGYDFGGWFDNSSLTGSAVTTISTSATGNKEYWAKWTASTYTVTLNTNSGTVNAGNITSYTYGTGATLPSNVTKTGYDFGGWFDNSGLTGSAVTTISTSATGNKEYWAKWTPIDYTISYDLAGGSVTAANPENYTIETETFTLTNPTREGYTFAGWTGTGLASATTTVTIAKGSTGGRNYTATWTPITYTINYDLAGGSATNPTSYTIETAIFTLNNPTKDGYIFLGWTGSNGETPETEVSIANGSTGNKSYTAHWTPSEQGDLLDIVDWEVDGSGKVTAVTLNMNGYTSATAKSDWKVRVIGIDKTYNTDDRAEDRTMRIDLSSLNLTADGTVAIEVLGTADALESHHNYRIPHIVTPNTPLSGTTDESIVYVREGTLILDTDLKVKKMIVCPGAELEVNSELTCTDLVLRTEDYSSAILTDNGTIIVKEQTYYTRRVADKINTYPFGLPFDADISGHNVKLSNGVELTHGTDYGLLEYDGALRADQGKTNGSHSNWKMTTTLTAGKGYQLASTSRYYYELYFPVTYQKTTPTPDLTLSVSYHTGKAGKMAAGWNYLVSPFTQEYHCESFKQPEELLKISVLNSDGKTYDQFTPTSIKPIKPATPFFYQADASGWLDFTSGSLSFRKSAAPRRMGIYNPSNDVPTQWIELLFGNAADELDIINNADRTNIYLHPTKFSAEYELGYDVAKLSTQGARPLLWVKTVAGDLAFAALPDTLAQNLPLTVSVPAEGVYTFALNDNDYTSRIDNIILLDALTGTETDLRRDTYTCLVEEGQTTARFFLNVKMKQQGITTEVDELGKESAVDRPVKLFIDGYIYILMPDGRMYDAVGKRVK